MTQNEDFLQNYSPSGKELKIYTYPAPILKKIAKPVTEFDDKLRELIKNMLFTMYNAPGIGLAAPQVGESIRLFVMDIDFERELIEMPDGTEKVKLSNFNPLVIINPEFTNKDGEILYEEGCLSVPGVYEEVKRAKSITVNFQDMYGNHKSMDAEDLLSICLQHENDHLEGIVFLERLSPLKRKFLTTKYLKNKKRQLERI